MNAKLLPYLLFPGTARDAMAFYQSILGGDLKLQSFADANIPTSEENKNLIIHAALENGPLSFFATDGDAQHPVSMGNNISMSLMGNDEAQLTEWFTKLSEGGKVDMPLAKQFWGDTYGQLTDKFGIHWMVNIYTGQLQQS